jgi:hypothetical protein
MNTNIWKQLLQHKEREREKNRIFIIKTHNNKQ